MSIGTFVLPRRRLLQQGAGLVAGMVFSPFANKIATAADRVRTTIKDLQTMTIGGPSRSYVYVRVVGSDGNFGIAEAYGTPGVGVAEQILSLKPLLVGKDPLEIDKIYTFLGDKERSLSGSRTDGSAHGLMRAASAIDMALWDLAGRMLREPTSILLGGQFRDKVRVYDHSHPRDMFSKESCREWAQKVKSHPSGFTAHKINVPVGDDDVGPAAPNNPRDPSNRQITTRELIRITQGFENMREAVGWDHDLMVHCHWQFDVASSLRLAEAVAPIKPLWLEDPLPVDYSEAWKRLTSRSPVTILTGENLARKEGFAPFVVNQGCDIVNPDLRNSGGFLETKRIADLASAFGLSVTNHNTGSQLHTYQACQWASSIRDYLMCETVTGEGGWMDQILKLDGPYIQNGYIRTSDKSGTGVELNREVVEAHLLPGQKWWGDI